MPPSHRITHDVEAYADGGRDRSGDDGTKHALRRRSSEINDNGDKNEADAVDTDELIRGHGCFRVVDTIIKRPCENRLTVWLLSLIPGTRTV